MSAETAEANAAPLSFDPSAGREQLTRLFLDRPEVSDGLIELAWAECSDWTLRHGESFPATPEGVEKLLARAAVINKLPANCYVGAALRNPDAAPFGRAGDKDFYAATAIWADLDEPQAAAAAAGRLIEVGARPSLIVTTGTTPSPRYQLWWILDEPTPDGAAVRKLNEAMVVALGSDATVVNVSRVMRLAGSVSHPPPQKQARGYIAEVTALGIVPGPPYPLDRLERLFAPRLEPIAAPGTPAAPSPAQAPRQATLPAQAPANAAGQPVAGVSRVSDLVRKIKAGQLWHDSMVKLVAHLVSTGRANAEILAWTPELTLPGYTVDQTRRELQQAIDGARRKWNVADADEAVDGVAGTAGARVAFVTAHAFVSDFSPPGYLIDGVIQRSYLYSWTAPTGHGKTATAIYMALCVATGRKFGPFDVEQGRVGILAGENPDDVRARLIAAGNYYGIALAGLPLWIIPGAYDLTGKIADTLVAIDAIGGLDMVLIDTAAAYSRLDDENSNAALGDYARIMRKLTFATGKPAIVVPCHPIKTPTRDNLMPRGGGAFLAEVDGNLVSWKHDEVLSTFHWQHKLRGAPFEPVEFEMRLTDDPALKDTKGRPIPTVMAVPQDEDGVARHAAAARSDEDRLLVEMLREGGRSFAAMATGLRWTTGKINIVPHKTRVARAMARLKDDALVRKGRGGSWWLTEKGEGEARKVVMNERATDR